MLNVKYGEVPGVNRMLLAEVSEPIVSEPRQPALLVALEKQRRPCIVIQRAGHGADYLLREREPEPSVVT